MYKLKGELEPMSGTLQKFAFGNGGIYQETYDAYLFSDECPSVREW